MALSTWLCVYYATGHIEFSTNALQCMHGFCIHRILTCSASVWLDGCLVGWVEVWHWWSTWLTCSIRSVKGWFGCEWLLVIVIGDSASEDQEEEEGGEEGGDVMKISHVWSGWLILGASEELLKILWRSQIDSVLVSNGSFTAHCGPESTVKQQVLMFNARNS